MQRCVFWSKRVESLVSSPVDSEENWLPINGCHICEESLSLTFLTVAQQPSSDAEGSTNFLKPGAESALGRQTLEHLMWKWNTFRSSFKILDFTMRCFMGFQYLDDADISSCQMQSLMSHHGNEQSASCEDVCSTDAKVPAAGLRSSWPQTSGEVSSGGRTQEPSEKMRCVIQKQTAVFVLMFGGDLPPPSPCQLSNQFAC